LRQQFAKLVDHIDQMVVLLIDFRQTGDEMVVPDNESTISPPEKTLLHQSELLPCLSSLRY